jgi:hypothetical protein
MLQRELSKAIEPTATQRAIEALNEKYSNAIPIFGGALWVNDLKTLVGSLPSVISGARFFKWHAGVADACRTFCHLCFIDPALVECYILTIKRDVVSHCSKLRATPPKNLVAIATQLRGCIWRR